MKKTKSVIFLMFMLTILITTIPINQTKAMSYDSTFPNGVLMYVGNAYSEWTVNELKTLKNNMKINEYVMCFGNYEYNYATSDPSSQIITKTIIDSIESTQIAHHNYLSQIKNELNSAIVNGETSNYNLQSLANKEVSLVKLILKVDPAAKIWLAFPHTSFTTVHDKYFDYYKQYLITQVKNQLSSSQWEKIIGFYWGNEQVVEMYTPMYPIGQLTDSLGAYFSGTKGFDPLVHNGAIRAMYMTSDYIRNVLGKKFMWIPYSCFSGSGWDNGCLKRMSFVANQAEIFDYIVLQTGYAFGQPFSNLQYVDNCVNNNKVASYYPKWNTAIIGAELEFYDDIGKWNSYISQFKKWKGQKPIVTYMDIKEVLIKNYSYLNSFYE